MTDKKGKPRQQAVDAKGNSNENSCIEKKKEKSFWFSKAPYGHSDY